MMENQDKFVAYIPVRGGSKSIPLKNIKPIGGRPLVYWVIDAAVNCSDIDKVYVSTDSIDIEKAVEEYKKTNANSDKLFCIGRAAHTATDTASTESAMLDFAGKYDFEHMILIQATSPLLTSKHLEEAISTYKQGANHSLLSVVRQKRFIWEETAEGAKPVNYNFLKRPRRQEFDGYLVENGAFYITRKQLLLETECRISGKIGVYEMEEETYFEIDEPSDWMIIENLMSKRIAKEKNETKTNVKKTIKLFATDCDGCLTDGGMYYTESGDELKKFSTQDGKGFELLRNQGIKTAIITSEDRQLVKRRADKLKIDALYMGVQDKLSVIKELATKFNLTLDEIAYMGDDLNDLEVLQNVGLSFSVPNGRPEVRAVADIVVPVKGGDGAIREAVTYILNQK
jgi:N-acylneuraminate cytidylyltransferase